MKRKTAWISGITGAAVVLAAIYMWTAVSLTSEGALSRDSLTVAEREFEKRLQQAARQGQKRVDVASLTTFDWRRVCYVGVYGAPAHFEDDERKQLAARGAFNLPWVGSEGAWGLIFTTTTTETIRIRILRDPDVPSAKMLAEQGVSLESLQTKPACFSREEAVLMLFQNELRHFAFLTRR